jgi:hypothetical protein
LNVVRVNIAVITLSVIAQGEEGGERAEEGGEGRHVVCHVRHSVRGDVNTRERETGCEFYEGRI